jgi:Na+/melibiose symporter-like transporter
MLLPFSAFYVQLVVAGAEIGSASVISVHGAILVIIHLSVALSPFIGNTDILHCGCEALSAAQRLKQFSQNRNIGFVFAASVI